MTLPQYLLRDGVLSYLFGALPVFAVLYLLGIPHGNGPLVALLHLASLPTILVAVALHRRTFIEVTATEILEQGYFGGIRSSPIARVHSVTRVETYLADTSDTVPQLLVTDADGLLLLRMRGIFWPEASMDAVSAALGGATGRPLEPMATGELFRRFPGSRYWFEQNPLALGIAIAAAIAFAAVGMPAMMLIAGIPLSPEW